MVVVLGAHGGFYCFKPFLSSSFFTFSLAIQKTVNDNYLFHQVCMSNLIFACITMAIVNS